MNAKVTLLLALAVVAISSAYAQYSNEGPNNAAYTRTNVGTGVQEAANVHSKHASNKNTGYNIAGKSSVENEEIAQAEKYGQSYQPSYQPSYY